MGQGQSQPKQNQDYLVVQQLPVGDIVRNIKSQTLHFLRQHTYNSQQSYQNALNSQSLKLSNKNEHLLNFQHFITKSETSFCSSFFKLTLIFQYVQYSLEKQLLIRIKDQRFFNEKQIWSILCSTVLAAVHLINYEGYMHCGLTTKDIRLNPDGCVKILNNQMIGIDKKHTQNEGTPKMLAISLIECMTLKKLTNEQNSFLEALAGKLNYSSDMKDIIKLMVRQDQKFTEIQKQLFKLAQDNDSLSSYERTPSIRSHSRISSNHRGSSAKRESEKKKLISILNRYQQNQPLSNDNGDETNFLFFVELNQQTQNPDQVLQKPSSQISQDEISEQNDNLVKQNYFIPIKNMTQSQNYSNPSQRSQKNHLQNYQINSALPSHRSQRQKRKCNANLKEENKKQQVFRQQVIKNEQIFTDPQFICRIKNDLQNIRIRREKQNSNEQKSREKSIISSHILLQEISKFQSQQNSKSKVSNTSSKNNQKSNLSQYESKQNLHEYICEDNLLPYHQKNGKNAPSAENIEFKQENKNQKINIQTQPGEQNFQYELTQSNSLSSGNSARYYFISNSIQHQQAKYIHVNEQFNRGSYQGTKLNGKRHGFGTFHYSEGGKYVGNWKQNRMNGKGILYYPDHKVAYDGDWQNDQLSGYGILYNEEVSEFKEAFDYEDFSNVQEYWVKYQGHFSEDNKEGEGKIYLVNGQRFEGQFKADAIDGEGIFYKYDGGLVKGKWIKNKLIQTL